MATTTRNSAAGPRFLRYHVIDMAGEMNIEVGVPVATPLPGDGRVKTGPSARRALRQPHLHRPWSCGEQETPRTRTPARCFCESYLVRVFFGLVPIRTLLSRRA